MSDDQKGDRGGGAKSHGLEAVANSAAGLLLNRFGVPVLLALIAWLGRQSLDDIKASVSEVKVEQKAQSIILGKSQSDIRDINTRLDAQVLRQVDTNSKQINNHEERLQRIERLVPTP